MATAAEILAAIDEAILDWAENGCSATISYAGKTRTFADIDHLRKFRAVIKDEIAGAAAGSVRPFKTFGLRFRKPA